jgi:hypothetical protein
MRRSSIPLISVIVAAVACSMVLALAAGLAVAAPPGNGSIEGKVTYASGNTAFVTVRLIDGRNKLVASTTSSADGYRFDNVRAGTYTVMAGSGGPFGTKTVQVQTGQTAVCNFVLPDPLPPPPGEDPIDPPPVLD